MTPMNIKFRQKGLLDYGRIISQTDDELLHFELSDYARLKFKEMIKDCIKRARELRAEFAKMGIYQFGTIFIDYDCRYININVN